ncbi:hypothetical protein ACIX9V_004382 [Vibrio vulnificus]|nr:hypothetical protein [Vibrio vulnificus]EIF8196567.1 hypothetical protein [Vibrio vulnificus]ELE7275853.1 hypothetical protein [Vibrio vulnificus]
MSKTVLVTPKFITDSASYWAMFYCAILKTILYQKNLTYNLKGSSLQSYRGELKHPANFFNAMKGSIRNHGFEYLMIDFLRSNDGKDLRDILIGRLLERFGVHDFEYNFMNVFKLGEDSTLYDEIVEYDDPDVKVLVPGSVQAFTRAKKILTGFTYPVSNIARSFPSADLLIMVSDGKSHTYGFVGEVEGHHGEKLLQSTYWKKDDGIKGRYTTFALGASDRKIIDGIKVKQNVVLHSDVSGREIVNFSNANEFIKAFHHAINNITLCLSGHYSNLDGLDDSHRKIVNIIADGWNKNLPDVVKDLERYIQYDVSIDEYSYQSDSNEHTGTVFKPSPIIQNNQFHLHRIHQ